jgi:hypothetical protein
MPDMPQAEQLDFLLEHGKQYAILGSGQRVKPGKAGLSSDAGTHLVAGAARKGVYSFHRLPPGVPQLDPARRWLGIKGSKEPTLALFDLSMALSPGFHFQWSEIKGRVAIHPKGDLRA